MKTFSAFADSRELRKDEIKICGILQQRSDAHMHELARAYQAAHKIKLSDM